jgi:hypothetical protein
MQFSRGADMAITDTNNGSSDNHASLVDDADYVLKEIARGEVFSSAIPDPMQAAIDALSAAVVAYRAASPAKPEDFATVEKALSKLMALMTPISVLTLRDTDRDTPPHAVGWVGRQLQRLFPSWPFFRRNAEAYRFSTMFFWLTIATVAAALTLNYWEHGAVITGAVGKIDYSHWDFAGFAKIVAPFSYGAMGACVFLLRSLHKHIYGRTFDRRRRPEYFNRVLLGAISGGTLVLLLDSDSAAASNAVKLGHSALGFLAGYNTDLLFSAIERITNAVFPKPPEPPPAVPATTP